MLPAITFDAPTGPLTLAASRAGLALVYFGERRAAQESRWFHRAWPYEEMMPGAGEPLLARTVEQLQEYFRGERREFDLPLDMRGTAFQVRVWKYLQTIPYGTTISYGKMARDLTSSARAVGAANGSNHLPIVVPCHRVIAADGSLCGFGGGLPNKKRLLELEGAWTEELSASQGALFD